MGDNNIFGTSRGEVEVCNGKCCSMQFAVHLELQTKVCKDFTIMEKAPTKQGDLIGDLNKDASLIMFSLSKMLSTRLTQLVGCPQPLVHTAYK